MTTDTTVEQPTAAEARILATAHAAGYTKYTLADLRRNRSRAVESAMKQAERALKEGNVERAQMFIELAGAVERDGE